MTPGDLCANIPECRGQRVAPPAKGVASPSRLFRRESPKGLILSAPVPQVTRMGADLLDHASSLLLLLELGSLPPGPRSLPSQAPLPSSEYSVPKPSSPGPISQTGKLSLRFTRWQQRGKRNSRNFETAKMAFNYSSSSSAVGQCRCL